MSKLAPVAPCKRVRAFAGVVAAFSALAGAGAAHGQVYKCLGHDGRITYSDQACKGVARVSEITIEPNVIDTSADRAPRAAAVRQPSRGRDERPTPECERAAKDLETARKTDGLAPRELRAAYDRIVVACAVGAPEPTAGGGADAPRDPRPRTVSESPPRVQRPAPESPQVRVLPLPPDAQRVPAAN